jgi:gluconokinase
MNVVFMGVCGCGKTTLAARTAEYLQSGVMIEADSYHSPEMKQKMGSGIPLTDDDRWPWLDRLNQAMRAAPEPWSVVTCSALKRRYRERLTHGLQGHVHFIFLDAPSAVIGERLAKRRHEYMPASLLESQFAALELPEVGEPISTVSVAGSEDESFAAIQRVLEELQRRSAS